MESAIRHGYDAELVLRAPKSAALTADTTSALIPLDRITNSVRGALDGKFEERNFSVVVYLEAGFALTTNETYTLNFNTYDANSANPTTHLSKTFLAAQLGEPLVFDFDTGTLAFEDADAALFGVALDVAGTAPSASFWAFIAPTA